jgi:hypothetical protein
VTNLQQQAKLARLLVEQQKGACCLRMLARKLGSAIKARVTLIAADGKVLGDSDVRDDQVDRTGKPPATTGGTAGPCQRGRLPPSVIRTR